MINERYARTFCKDDISEIENYDKAIADTTHTWHCHHRDEIRTLPSGMTVYRSRQELNENGRYCQCPANELIFLTCAEHMRLHRKNLSHASRQKLSEAHKGKTHSDETRKKMSDAHKGRHWKLVDGKCKYFQLL